MDYEDQSISLSSASTTEADLSIGGAERSQLKELKRSSPCG